MIAWAIGLSSPYATLSSSVRFLMTTLLLPDVFLGIAAIPFIYYALAIFSSLRFFLTTRAKTGKAGGFVPPVSNLKPVRGLDPEAYENFASFCRQDYPDYEILFCIGDTSDPVFPVLQQLVRDFPGRQIRIVIGSGRIATNDKVAKLARLVEEASHEYLVISDSDVRVEPDYLRKVVAPLANPKTGAVTFFYLATEKTTLVYTLQGVWVGLDFFLRNLLAKPMD